MSVPASGDASPARRAAGRRPTGRPDAFRRAVGHFATGVTVVTTRVGTFDHAMTASAFTSVSLEPVLVLVCVDKEARFRDAVLESGTWAVSVLSASGRRAADWFATKGRPLVGQLDRYPAPPRHRDGAALLDGSLAWLECRDHGGLRRRRPRHRRGERARGRDQRPGGTPAGLLPRRLPRAALSLPGPKVPYHGGQSASAYPLIF